jgi:quercetin dioxygenase-like cupin family protein
METVSTALWSFTGPASPPLPGAGATMRQVHVKAGHVAARHSHEHEQFLLVLSGAARLECETGTVEFRPGTVVRFAPGAWHSAEFFEDTVLVEFNLAEPG